MGIHQGNMAVWHKRRFVPSTYFIEHHWKSLALLVVSPKLTAAVQKDSAVQILIGPPGVGKYKLCCPVLECRDNANGSPNAHKYHSIGTVLRHWLFPLPVGLYIQHMASISRCLFLPWSVFYKKAGACLGLLWGLYHLAKLCVCVCVVRKCLLCMSVYRIRCVNILYLCVNNVSYLRLLMYMVFQWMCVFCSFS